ncbi:MAG: hypothetical protein D6705_15195 [Deltaproteobacteria bacterium]|nr:MAG: hypothetical protein D6705_15195 [Deltaproteobacteria bacterium]
MTNDFTGVKIFSATKAREREEISDRITDWIAANRNLEIVGKDVLQSSDNAFHCLTIVLYYKHK